MAINNRNDFKSYCLRRLGDGVIKINVSDDQVEDRIDDALDMWQDVHYDGYEETFLKHQLTQTDLDNGYISIPDRIMQVSGIIPIRNKGSSIPMFNIEYQLRLHDIFDLHYAGSLANYVQVKQYIGLLDDILNSHSTIEYSRRANKLYFHSGFSKLGVGDYIVVKVFAKVDPDTYSNVWNDKWLKAYATALIKKQWGENIKKFEGVTMLGGVTMNGQVIYDDAMAEIEDLKQELHDRYTEPVDFIVG